jgi:hypothetical protein
MGVEGVFPGRLSKRAEFFVEVTAEDNVGTAAGHVGGDGDRSWTPGLRDNAGLTLVLFGVQSSMSSMMALYLSS